MRGNVPTIVKIALTVSVESVSSFLFMVLGVCMMAVSAQPGLAFDKCRTCHYTSASVSCVSSDMANHCKDEGCHGYGHSEDCAKCICVKLNRNECECQSPSTTGK